ncbi:MAG: hypothetical protein ACRCT1_20160 [Microcoleaceae cyanobacterium]
MPIPLMLTVAKMFTVGARALPLLARVGGAIMKIPGMGFLSKSIGGFFAKLAPWAAGVLGWFAVDKGASWLDNMSSKVVSSASYFWHYDWGASEKQLIEGIKNSFEALYEPLGEAVGRSIASLIMARRLGGGSAGIPTLQINVGMMASLVQVAGGDEQVRENLIESVALVWNAIRNAAIAISIKFIHLNGRRFFEKTYGKLPEESESWSFAEQYELKVKKLVPNEKIADAIISGTEAFFDTIGEFLIRDGQMDRKDQFVEFVR